MRIFLHHEIIILETSVDTNTCG